MTLKDVDKIKDFISDTYILDRIDEQPTVDPMEVVQRRKGILSKNEAYAVAEFIDMNIFSAIRNDDEWDSSQALRNLVHAYEKCCEISGYVGLTDFAKEELNEIN